MDNSQETLKAIQALEVLRDSYKDKYIKTDEMIVMLGGVSSVLDKESSNQKPALAMGHKISIQKKAETDFSKMKIIEKVIYLIKESDKFLRRQTIEHMAEQKGSPFTGSIASTISTAKKDGKSGITLVEKNGISAWGLKEWVDENNEVLDEHYFKFTNAE